MVNDGQISAEVETTVLGGDPKKVTSESSAINEGKSKAIDKNPSTNSAITQKDLKDPKDLDKGVKPIKSSKTDGENIESRKGKDITVKHSDVNYKDEETKRKSEGEEVLAREPLNLPESGTVSEANTKVDKKTHGEENNNEGTEIIEQVEGERQGEEEEEELENHEEVEEEGAEYEDDGSETSESVPEFNNKRIILQRFTIYNSKSTMYIVGSNAKESLFRILEINKDLQDETNLTILEDKSYFYTRKDMIDLINGLNESIDGGIHKIAQGYGLLGLIKFTKGYYLSIITKCSQVAIIGGHFIYHIDETKLIPLDINYRRPNKYTDEEKLLSIFKYLDLGKTFYFSYAYDITNTLQTNFVRNKKLATEYQRNGEFASFKKKFPDNFDNFNRNERFVWNKLLLKPILNNKDIATYEWFQPIIHGFIDQANISIYGKKIYITIIARRSRHFAGARFLKRGVNYDGNVANEIETEQIVTDMLMTSFHDPKYGFYNNPRFTSFVQHRGSIPLYWTQDLNRLPKPPIEINLSDPFYQSSAIHFNNLFQRYGLPVIILNLIKTKEKTPRELKLNKHFVNCVNYLNQFLPLDHKLQFNSFDMSKHSKKNLDVIVPLQNIATDSILKIGFFHNGTDLESTKIQNGIIRTNCIDCLDRTNAAQFIICKEALSHQLASLGLISKPTNLAYDSDLINILTEIFHDHGDTIAIQYGGSNLVNTMDSYRRINQWSSHTRDMLNSVKRIYSNSFMDLIRQEAINLFLGNYIYDVNKPKLWELQNDFYLHNNIADNDIRRKISYTHWYNGNYLNKKRFDLTQFVNPNGIDEQLAPFIYERLRPFPEFNDNWFNECYVPRKFQSLTDIFMFNMNSNSRYFPSNLSSSKKFDYSPFESRKQLIRRDEVIDNRRESKGKSTSKTNKYENIKTVGNLPINDEDMDNSGSDLDSDSIEELKANESLAATNESSYYNYRIKAASFTEDGKDINNDTTADGGYNYLNITNTKKIKNLLTSGMEKLGYSKIGGSNNTGAGAYKNKHTYINSDTDNRAVNESDDDDMTLYSGVPSLNEYDRNLYLKQNDLSSLVTPVLDTTSKGRIKALNDIKLEDVNAEFYKQYTTAFDEADYNLFLSDIYSRFHGTFNTLAVNSNANAIYLGMRLPSLDVAHDDYFR